MIGLERINRLEILPALFDPILAPPEVQQEFGPSLPWLRVQAPTNKALLAALRLDVDDGEAAAIALAAEKGWRVILDDRRARSVAVRLGARVIGTVGVLAILIVLAYRVLPARVRDALRQ